MPSGAFMLLVGWQEVLTASKNLSFGMLMIVIWLEVGINDFAHVTELQLSPLSPRCLLLQWYPVWFDILLMAYPGYPGNWSFKRVLVIELRRLHFDFDLIWCYKINFGLVVISCSSIFVLRSEYVTRGHPYKIFKHRCSCTARSSYFSEHVTDIWNSFPSFHSRLKTHLFDKSFLP